MTGAILGSPYIGTQAEYLFTAFLSKFASVIPVPRQEDYGIDHLGFIAETSGNLRKIGFMFGIQLKPEKDKTLLFGESVKAAGNESVTKWKGHQIEWLFNQDQPFFLVTYEDEISPEVDGGGERFDRIYRMYSTAAMWHVRWMSASKPFQVELNWSAEAEGTFVPPVYVDVVPPNGSIHDGLKWKVNLGAPVVEMRLSELVGPSAPWELKAACLKHWIQLDQRNIYHSRLGIPNYDVFYQWERNQEPSKQHGGWAFAANLEGNLVGATLNAITPAIRALAGNLIRQGKVSDIDAVIPLLRLLQAYGYFDDNQARDMTEQLQSIISKDSEEKNRVYLLERARYFLEQYSKLAVIDEEEAQTLFSQIESQERASSMAEMLSFFIKSAHEKSGLEIKPTIQQAIDELDVIARRSEKIE